MIEPTEARTRPRQVSEVDRANRPGVPGANRWSNVIAIAFIIAIVVLSFTPEYAAVPGALRAAMLEWSGAGASPQAN